MEQNLKEKLEAQASMTKAHLKLLERFPDLKEHRDRWNNSRFCTPLINEQVDKAQIHHNCGCCPDSPLEVWPFKKINGIKIFSEPPCFTVGEKDCYSDEMSERPYENWQRQLRDSNIPENVISIVQKYFNDSNY